LPGISTMRTFPSSSNPERSPRVAKIAVTFDDTKFRLHQAYRAAKAADRLSGALYDRWMAEALMLVKGQPIERAVAMLHRTAVMLEIAAERKGWPDRITGLPDARPRRKVMAGIAGAVQA
jgi:hypothetical protein